MLNQELEAIILVGGEGTRLRSVVCDRPKPMAEVAGKPFVEHLVIALKAQGIRRIIFSTGYLGEQVAAYFGTGDRWDVEITYSQEAVPLGTGGAVRLALAQVKGDRCLVLNGDSYCRLELASLLAFHRQRHASATLQLVLVEDCSRYGSVVMDSQGAVQSFREKQVGLGAGWVNAGVYLLERQAIEQIPPNQALSIETEFFPQQVGRGLYAFTGTGTLLDIGTPESYAQAESFLVEESKAEGRGQRAEGKEGMRDGGWGMKGRSKAEGRGQRAEGEEDRGTRGHGDAENQCTQHSLLTQNLELSTQNSLPTPHSPLPTPRFVLLDRDGTLIIERHYLSQPDQVELLPGVGAGLRHMRQLGLGLILVTNQSGIGRGFFDKTQLEEIHWRLRELLTAEGVELDGIYYCPHTPDDRCICRKPETGLIQQAAVELGFHPFNSFVIGDKPCDIELGQRVGATTLLVKTGYGAEVAAQGTVKPDAIVENLAEAAEVIQQRLLAEVE
ncbi:HAD-IIIA family hydrolase [Kovacikia minuta CCNUW1]|uniref:HAD-IIIA family hydrolase n=1 Tax=Kovacikia minuta TaxID=2931930 RepID=UPI001CCDA5A7|nr:HAD-IIIA family hydrolase [Kovacikia minuta]UBF26009.1 HAD-IIIA family hydrolase [Kovacikia minuta CCNUW1]